MTRSQFISYSNEHISAIRQVNYKWAMLHLDKLPAKIDRAIKRYSQKNVIQELQLDLFKEVNPVTDQQIRIRVIRKFIAFLKHMDRQIDLYREYQSYVIDNWPQNEDVKWFDFLRRSELGIEYYADYIQRKVKTTSQEAL